MTNDFDNASAESLASLDASLAGQGDDWWDTFYANRARPCPFFGTAHDESLAEWVGDGLIRRGRAIDLGCGHARNSVFLARSGFSVEGVDYSQTAIEWAQERVADAGSDVALRHQSVFDLKLGAASYDLVYDSGCFHHMPPHRRNSYVVREIWSGGLRVHVIRQMDKPSAESGLFGERFLWVLLAQKP